MNSIVKFIRTSNLKEHDIYIDLKCDNEQAKILQFLTKQYISGVTNQISLDILTEFYDVKNFEHLEKIDLIKKLLELGWIEQNDSSFSKISQLTNLELLNTNVKLSSSFLKLLELGSNDLILPEIKEYNDHLEYLQDQFLKVTIAQELNIVKYDFDNTSPNINALNSKLELINTRIKKRLDRTKQNIMLEDFFKENRLSDEEQMIFLALLKEEYSSSDESIRDINSLIALISNDDYEKIKFRPLLEESGTLIKNNIIDYDEILTPIGGIIRNFYILDSILYKISHPKAKDKRKSKIKIDTLIEKQKIFELIKPKKKLKDIVLNETTKETINTLLSQVNKDVIDKLKLWGIKDKRKGIDSRIIFYGSAGTGKTITALAIAKQLKRKVLSFDCSKILSMYIGESEKNVRAIFDSYKEISKKTKTKPILLLNEADQFLSNRLSGATNSSDKMHNQMQNIFLEQIEKFDGILIATTNLLDSIDKAFSRRFNYKIEFKKPNLNQRFDLWNKLLPVNLPFSDDFNVTKLSSFELSGGQIETIIKNTAYKIATTNKKRFEINDFILEINKEIESSFDSNKKVGFRHNEE